MGSENTHLARGGTRSPSLLAWLRLARVFQQIDHLSAEHLREWGLSVAQFDLLTQVGLSEGLTQGDLARALLVTKGNVCQLLDRMERDGLLRRCHVGRANQLHLTDEGRRLFHKVVPAQEALIARLFSTLVTEEQVQLLGLLRKLDKSLTHADHRGDIPVAVSIEPKTTTWQIDPVHSLVEFSVRHMMVSNVKGRFAGLTGTIIEDNEDFSRSSVQAEIDVDTVDTRNEQRDGHLKSPDFLHLEQHPKITFKSTSIQGSGEQFKVAGDLTISGTTRPVTLNVTRNGTSTNPWGQVVVGYSAETTISRKDWGLTYNQALETGGFLVGDNLKIQLEIEAAKQA